MKILDPKNGSLRISDCSVITQETVLQEIVDLFGVDQVKIVDHTNGCQTVSVPNILISEYWFCFSFEFRNNLLYGIRIVLDEKEFSGGWETWSEAEEMRRLTLCEKWLYQQTRRSEPHFSWGNIQTLYDSKGGFASIMLKYE